jgi:hypothetical protein
MSILSDFERDPTSIWRERAVRLRLPLKKLNFLFIFFALSDCDGSFSPNTGRIALKIAEDAHLSEHNNISRKKEG